MDTTAEFDSEMASDKIGDLFRREKPRLSAYISSLIPDELDAEDFLQDVFADLVQSYRPSNPIDGLTGWIYAVARNKVFDWFRKKKEVSTSPDILGWDRKSGGSDAVDQIWGDAVLDAMYDALDELPKEQSQAFILHELKGLSIREIAQRTGANENTVLSRKRYATLHLRERLNDFYKDLII